MPDPPTLAGVGQEASFGFGAPETIPRQDFPLLSRWTQPTHAEPSPGELSSIHPFSERSATVAQSWLTARQYGTTDPPLSAALPLGCDCS